MLGLKLGLGREAVLVLPMLKQEQEPVLDVLLPLDEQELGLALELDKPILEQAPVLEQLPQEEPEPTSRPLLELSTESPLLQSFSPMLLDVSPLPPRISPMNGS
jgi:hypothetical protein